MKMAGANSSQLAAWDILTHSQLTDERIDYIHSAWKDEYYKHYHFDFQTPPNLEDVRSQHWKLVAIDGKSPDDIFFNRLSRGIHVVNTLMRNLEQVNYLPTRDLWHDLIGHLPSMSNEIVDRFIRGLGILYRLNPSAVKELGNLYWWTIEFGICMENGQNKALGAGIISSINELDRAVINSTGNYRPAKFEDMISTEYDVYGVQDQYFVLESLDQLDSILKKAFKTLC